MRYNRLYKDNNFLTPTTYTQTLSEYAANLKYEDIPPEVVERAKMIMLQTIGVTLGAKGTPIYEKALRMAKEANGGAGGATTMWGTGEKLSAINAALNSFNKVLLANHIRTCVAEDIREGKDETIDELVTVLQKLMR